MSTKTKMIIITTDEDLVRRLAVNKNKNTQIIDIGDNDDLVDLPFLAELSQYNSTTDQVFKRALDSTDDKSAKIRRRSVHMICVICGDKAIGYNYDALTCGSCRAFFRRNAFKDLDSLRCLSEQGKCSFSHEIRKKCARCRLERCFAVGMRKDFMTNGGEEKQQRQTSTSNDNESPISTDEIDRLLTDVFAVDNIRSIFLSTFQRDLSKPTSYFDYSDNASALINWSFIVHESALSNIKFFRQIKEFEELDNNDRFILIKFNLFPNYPVLKAFYYDNNNGFDINISQEEKARRHRFFSICFGSEYAVEIYMNIIRSLVRITEQDPAIIGLLLIILMFSQGLSMSEDEPPLNNTLQVNKAQSHYVEILWSYMINKWGDFEAHKRFSQLMLLIFQLQIAAKTLREFFCNEIRTSNTIDKIAPLMQTVLHIS